MIQKRLVLIINFFGAQNYKFLCWEPEPLFFARREPEPTQFGRSRLRDLGLPEPEPPKKVAAPQHCLKLRRNLSIRPLKKCSVVDPDSREVAFKEILDPNPY